MKEHLEDYNMVHCQFANTKIGSRDLPDLSDKDKYIFRVTTSEVQSNKILGFEALYDRKGL